MWIIALGCALIAQPEPRVVRGPYLQSLLSTSVEIAWRTDSESLGAVRLRAAGGGKAVHTEPAAGLEHRVRIEGLSPATLYEYAILDGGTLLAEGLRFRTAPPPGEGELHAVVTGDSGVGRDEQRSVAALMAELDADLFIHTGDFDYLGDLDEAVFAPYETVLARSCFFPARGNHDIRVDWRAVFAPPGLGPVKGSELYYSFDWGPVHFAVIDSNLDALSDGDQLGWIESDLAAVRARGSQWICLVLHEPVFTIGAHSLQSPSSRELVEKLADDFEVDLVLSGHDHNFQRSHPVRGGTVLDAWQDPAFRSPRGTVYLVTGGGGAILYPELIRSDHRFTRVFRSAHHALELRATASELRVRAVSPGKEVLDEFMIEQSMPPPGFRIIRGDVDASGRLDLGDAVGILGHLFLGTVIECHALATEAADVNGEGSRVDISDAVYLLEYLFLGGPPPAPPFPDCGPAADPAGRWCTSEACPPLE